MQYTFTDLVDIMARLRGEGGCPWDAEQTHQSLRKNLIEEAYESLEAIDSGDGAIMADELGDLLLQIVFHAQIGKENGTFTIDDVTDAICQKMIRRHPHVFSDGTAKTSADVLEKWDEIKKQEKKQSKASETLSSVSAYLPALMRAEKVQTKAAKVGFDWPDALSALEKVREETEEVSRALRDKHAIEEEIGDLLFSVVNVARLAALDAEETMQHATEKFIRRFSKMEEIAVKTNKKLDELHIDELELLWKTSKIELEN